jgi:hypothetical protein
VTVLRPQARDVAVVSRGAPHPWTRAGDQAEHRALPLPLGPSRTKNSFRTTGDLVHHDVRAVALLELLRTIDMKAVPRIGEERRALLEIAAYPVTFPVTGR